MFAIYGAMAEWLGRGLQNLVHRFNSGSRLQSKYPVNIDSNACLGVKLSIMPIIKAQKGGFRGCKLSTNCQQIGSGVC